MTIVTSYTRKNITRLLPLALLLVLRTCNNTDSNKLVILSGIAWYYGDNYILALLLIVLTFHNIVRQWKGPKMQPCCAYQPDYKLPPHQEAPKIQIPPYYGHTVVIPTGFILEELYRIPTN